MTKSNEICISDGVEGLVEIADILDSTSIPHIQEILKGLASRYTPYRTRVANCLKSIGATPDEMSQIIRSSNGDEIFTITRKVVDRAGEVPAHIKSVILSAGTDVGGYRSLILDKLHRHQKR